MFSYTRTTQSVIWDHTSQTIRSMQAATKEELAADDVADRYIEKLTIHTPTLDYENAERSMSESSSGVIVTIEIRASGSVRLLESYPENHPQDRPEVEARLSTSSFLKTPDLVVFRYSAAEADTDAFKAWRERQYKLTDDWLSAIDREVSAWNAKLPELVRRELEDRRAKLSKIDGFDIDA